MSVERGSTAGRVRIRAGGAAAAALAVLAIAAVASRGATVGIAGPEEGPVRVTVPQGETVPFAIPVHADGAIKCEIREDAPNEATIPTAYTVDAGGETSSAQDSPRLPFFADPDRRKGGSDNCEVNWHGAPEPYQVSAMAQADVETPPGIYEAEVPFAIDSRGGSGHGYLSGAPDRIEIEVVDAGGPEEPGNETPAGGSNQPPPTTGSNQPPPPPPPPAGPSGRPDPDPEDPPALRPVVRKVEIVEPTRGTVLVREPGGRVVRIEEITALRDGSVIDARRGRARLIVAANRSGRTSTLNLRDGAVRVKQGRGAQPITDLFLHPGLGAPQGQAGAASAGVDTARKKRSSKRRRVWTRGKGRFRTRGRNASAIVRGTEWLTRDSSAGTYVRVRRGVVSVRDRVRKRTVRLRAGRSYLARDRRR